MPKVTQIHLPHYHVRDKPDHIAIGAQIDEHIRSHYQGDLVVRAISLSEKKKPIDEVVEEILLHGTDLINPSKGGRGYDKHPDIEFFAGKVNTSRPMTHRFIEPFYRKPVEHNFSPLRTDLYLIYDPNQVEMVPHQARGKERTDGYKFKDKMKKREALLGVVKVI